MQICIDKCKRQTSCVVSDSSVCIESTDAPGETQHSGGIISVWVGFRELFFPCFLSVVGMSVELTGRVLDFRGFVCFISIPTLRIEPSILM